MLEPIANRQIHLWRIDLSGSRELGSPESVLTLSHAERARATRIRRTEDQARYVAAHVAMRKILARYLGLSPAELRLRADRRGKPELDGTSIHFNLSHSGERALLAVARSEPVGADIEALRPVPRATALAARYFSASERTQLFACCPGPARDRAFLACWTRKEAFAKAVGIGLRLGFGRIEVGLGGERRVRGWSVRSVGAGAGYAAAVAIRGLLDSVFEYEFLSGAGDSPRQECPQLAAYPRDV